MVDVGRHTSDADGSPPKGESFEKYPRQVQAAEGVGGVGVGLAEPKKIPCVACGGVGGGKGGGRGKMGQRR